MVFGSNLIKSILSLMVIIKLILNVIMVKPPIQYEQVAITLNGHEQQVHTLSVDMKENRVAIENVLSFDSIYGFEETSMMVERSDAKAGINGMFYTIYGHHIGLMVKEGKLITPSRNETPIVAILENNQVYIGEVKTDILVKSQEVNIEVFNMNDAAYDGTWALYTRIYGSTTRIERPSVNYIINDGKVQSIIRSDGEATAIPEDGYILSYVGEQTNLFRVGDQVSIEIIYSPAIGQVKEAFQSGGWLVRDGKNMAKDFEPYMGNTRIPNPRTLFGVTAHGQVIVKVIDGRQKDSYGITGREAADLMLEASCTEAVYLDGGASSTMVVDANVVNKPSSNEERKVSHSIIFRNTVQKK